MVFLERVGIFQLHAMLLLDGTLIVERGLALGVHVPIVTIFLVECFLGIVFVIDRTALAQEQLVLNQFQVGADVQRCLAGIVRIGQLVQPVERITVTLAIAVVGRTVVEERTPRRLHALHTLEEVSHIIVVQFGRGGSGEADSSLYIKDREHLVIPVQGTAETAVFRTLHRSVFGIIPQRSGKRALFASSVKAQVMVLGKSRVFIYLVAQGRAVILKHNLPARHGVGHLLPAFLQQVFISVQVTDGILVGIVRPIHRAVTARVIDVGQASSRIHTPQPPEADEVLGIHVLVSLAGKVHAALEFIRYLGMASLAFLGLYQDDTVVGTRAVDGSRSGILQHLDRLNVGRVDVVHRTHHPVDHHQG